MTKEKLIQEYYEALQQYSCPTGDWFLDACAEETLLRVQEELAKAGIDYKEL